MKFGTFRHRGVERLGVAHDGDTRLFDLALAAGRAGIDGTAFASMLDLIDGGDRALDAARRLFADRVAEADLSHEVGRVELMAPLPVPRQMRDAMSFPLHILQGPRGSARLAALARGDVAEAARIAAEPLGELPEVYRQVPIYYITNRFTVGAPGSVVTWPKYSEVMDYELEFGCITKTKGTDISAARAKDHIFGFTIFNDFSARDAQRIEMAGRLGPAKGKSFNGGNVLGPWIVTYDEIGDPYRLRMQARVNGETRCDSDTSGMLYSFEEIIAHMSKDETLMPGEFIGSGTVGNGCGLETGTFLEDGDRIELDVEKIGILANEVRRQAG
ncbi:fumarylacetoacetate hydrolase family protein [Phreatobacter sp. AB_2022a]|uniref:fumarylacetoacetate hydrolase family protein n=1 Tax=Phreatobacter sp. AB_2022a TaxID=3003134 RepID=UPI0022873AF0|nr:fumarylacetoacetate hydrolase family protein [Phreatobacter sp. AB_2022a]MCZ0733703.1 fumarylacetoacetate hydrolase family protein [Phreatobacter sp. AB_2022a]